MSAFLDLLNAISFYETRAVKYRKLAKEHPSLEADLKAVADSLEALAAELRKAIGVKAEQVIA